MGAADVECAVEMAATTKPRERQFQVVPMPGVFTRGRWKCWDYRDESQPEKKEQILEFEKEKEKIEVTVSVPDTSTIIVTATTNNPEPLTPVSPDSVSNAETTPVKESSTIVVTSIAPHLPTPQHGTPQSIGEPSEMERMIQQSQLSHTVAEASSTPGTHVVVSATANDIHIQQPASVPATPAPQTTSLAPTATAPASVTMARAAEPSPSEEEIANSSTSNGAPSSANIDNKIEQAMDLVKTHLTFAVREEIEVLKQTIAELEQKVAAVESENQLLRQYAPVEIVSNLAALVQQQRAQAGATATAAATAAPAAVNSNNGTSSASVSVVPPPTKVTPSFCSSALATTLNNVVADVRQQVRYGQPKEQ